MNRLPLVLIALLFCDTALVVLALQPQQPGPVPSIHQQPAFSPTTCSARRSLLMTPIAAATASGAFAIAPAFPAKAADSGLALITGPHSGLKWADAKVGTGEPLGQGATASIDYSMASTVGRAPQIYTTKDQGTPFRWTLGSGKTIQGLELAILGSVKDDIPPMRPGGIRRVVIPANLGYLSLIAGGVASNDKCIAGNPGSIGPIPPKDNSGGAYQRWYQLYCNPRIPYQPDLVLDIKLYGKR